jgi:hypothetical protein
MPARSSAGLVRLPPKPSVSNIMLMAIRTHADGVA